MWKDYRLPYPYNRDFTKDFIDLWKNYQKAEEFGRKLYLDWINIVTEDKKRIFIETITQYTGSWYDSINEYLNKSKGVLYNDISEFPKKWKINETTFKKIIEKIKILDECFKTAKIKNGIMAYRRVTYHQFSEKYVKLREKNKIDRNFWEHIDVVYNIY